MPIWVQLVTALGGILGLGVAGGSPFFIRAQLKKFKTDSSVSEATAAESISRSANILLQPAIERAAQLEVDLGTMRKQAFETAVVLATTQGELTAARSEVASLRGLVAKMTTELQEARAELDQYRGGGTSGVST